MEEDFGLEHFDTFESKEHKKDMILSMHGKHFNIFADAIREPVEKLKSEIKNDSEKRDLLYEKLSGSIEPTHDDLDLYEGIADLSQAINWNLNQLFALNEMRVIYLYKDIEIDIKSLLNTAFSKVNIKKLFNWEVITAICKENNIKIEEIAGYKEVNELRQLNNTIKHSDYIDENCLKIIGIEDIEEAEVNEALENFCSKIEPKIALFKEELAKAVADELYEFPITKLDTMAQDLAERMDKEDAKKYINRLKYWLSLKD